MEELEAPPSCQQKSPITVPSSSSLATYGPVRISSGDGLRNAELQTAPRAGKCCTVAHTTTEEARASYIAMLPLRLGPDAAGVGAHAARCTGRGEPQS
jgi:hypothetical protein